MNGKTGGPIRVACFVWQVFAARRGAAPYKAPSLRELAAPSLR